MMQIRTGIVTKLVGATLRVVVFGPALMALFSATKALDQPTTWFTPMSRFWYLPVFSGLFALLCILPYPDALFRRAAKPLFLGVILLVCAFKLRHEFLPFHYAAPELASHPTYVAEFEAAKKEPNGLGFFSQRKEGGRLLWIVRKADYTTENVVIMGSVSLVPLILFLLRNHEVCRGITWRNFTSPPQPTPRTSKDPPPSTSTA